jgi:hypothetical protein
VPGGGIVQRPLHGGQLPVAADHVAGVGRHRVVLGQQPVPQSQRLSSRADTELAPQRPVQALELTKGTMAVAGGGVLAHEGQMGGLVAGLELDDDVPATVQP